MQFFVRLYAVIPHLSPFSVVLSVALAGFVVYWLRRAASARRRRKRIETVRRLGRQNAIRECVELIQRIRRAAVPSAHEREKRQVRTHRMRIDELVRRHKLDHMRDLGLHPRTLERFVAIASHVTTDREKALQRAILSGAYAKRTVPPAARAASCTYDPRTAALVPIDLVPDHKELEMVLVGNDEEVFAVVREDGGDMARQGTADDERVGVYHDPVSDITIIVDVSGLRPAKGDAAPRMVKLRPCTWDETLDADRFVDDAFAVMVAE